MKKTTSIFYVTLLLLIAPTSHAEDAAIASAQEISSAFEKVAKDITPSVVSISASKKPKVVALKGGRPKFNDPFFDQFKEFFGDDFAERFQAPNGGGGGDDGRQQGMGTGVIVTKDGLILTNHHVAGEADNIDVKLQDGRTVKAERIGTDPRTDICVIKIKATDLVPATLGDSDGLKIGEWVVAAGNPFGLDNSITAGIVSAKGRSIMGGSQFEDFIQTDAAINPGNSGGPLVNLKSEVVGINTAIFSRSGGYMGIGFAIPSKMVKSVMDSLLTKGKVVRGWLGVSIQNLTEELASSFSHEGTEGALVGEVQENTPASKAGLKQGDIIVKINGEAIKNVNQLRNIVASTSPGTSLALEVIRDNARKTVNAVVEELPASLNEATALAEEPEAQVTDEVGLKLDNLTPEIARQIRSKRTDGVIVMQVQPGSIAEDAGVQPRDVIISANGKPLKSVKDFTNIVTSKALERGVRLVMETSGMQRFVVLRKIAQ